MKKVIYAIISLFMLTACGGNDDPAPQKKVLDPNTQLHVHVRAQLSRSEYSAQHLSPRELLEKAGAFQCWIPEVKDHAVTRSIGDNEKDFDKLIIKMWGDDIVRDGKVVTGWRDVKDLLIIDNTSRGDTIGYIPQQVLKDAFAKILQAEKEENFDLVYKLFQDAFTAIPCTAEKYKELKEKGLN